MQVYLRYGRAQLDTQLEAVFGTSDLNSGKTLSLTDFLAHLHANQVWACSTSPDILWVHCKHYRTDNPETVDQVRVSHWASMLMPCVEHCQLHVAVHCSTVFAGCSAAVEGNSQDLQAATTAQQQTATSDEVTWSSLRGC